MAYVYCAVEPVTVVTGYNNPWDYHATPFQQLENAFSVLLRTFIFERRDLVTGLRIYRTTDDYLALLKKDRIGSYLLLSGIHFYFLPTDPTAGAQVVRDWTPVGY